MPEAEPPAHESYPPPEQWATHGTGRGAGSLGLSWAMLIALSAVFVLLHALPATAPGTGTPTDPALQADAGLKLIARYSLGARQLAAQLPADQASSIEQLAGAMDDQAGTPTAKLRAAMVAAEITGPDSARARIHALLDDPSLDEPLRADARLVERLLEVTGAPARDAVTPDERAELRKRHHWFADVALSRGLPDTDPDRAAVLRSGARTLWTVLGAFLIAAVALLVGLVLLAVGVALFARGKLRPRFDTQPSMSRADRCRLLNTTTLFLAALLGASLVGDGLHAITGWDCTLLLLWACLPLAWWARWRGMDRQTWRTALGWYAPSGFARELGAGVMGYLAGLPIVAVGLVITLVLVAVSGARPTHPAVEQAAQSGGDVWTAARLLALGVIWAPVCEETFFRGAMYSHLRGWLRPLLSGLIVAVFFAALHPQGLTVVPALMSLAVVFALIREWRGSIVGSMTAHAIQNGFVMSMGLLLLGG